MTARSEKLAEKGSVPVLRAVFGGGSSIWTKTPPSVSVASTSAFTSRSGWTSVIVAPRVLPAAAMKAMNAARILRFMKGAWIGKISSQWENCAVIVEEGKIAGAANLVHEAFGLSGKT